MDESFLETRTDCPGSVGKGRSRLYYNGCPHGGPPPPRLQAAHPTRAALLAAGVGKSETPGVGRGTLAPVEGR